MPRIRQLADKYAREDFNKEIRGKRGELNLKSLQDLAEATGIPASTLGDKLRTPDDLDNLTIKQLRPLVKVLEPSEDILLRFLGVETKKANKYKKEDENMKKVLDWVICVLTSHHDEAVAAGICDFSGQGRDKYGN